MANKKFWLGMLVMVLVFGMTITGCDTGGGGGSGEQPPPTPLQQAINWANEDARRWTTADNIPTIVNPGFVDVPFRGYFPSNMSVDEVIVGERTFIQFVEDALIEAWYATYIHTPALWNAAKWKEVINGAFFPPHGGPWIPNDPRNNHYFDHGNELPLIIS